MTEQRRIILASRSPRRVELLRQIGVEPEIIPADIDESVAPGESAAAYVERMARDKASAVAVAQPNSIVIGADTSVVCAGSIYGKPRDFAEANAILQSLSDSTHEVLSAVAVFADGEARSVISETIVRFRVLSVDEIKRYWMTGEPCDKAGAYAIQGMGAMFIRAIQGSYSGVMGLPIFETADLLQSVDVALMAAVTECE